MSAMPHRRHFEVRGRHDDFVSERAPTELSIPKVELVPLFESRSLTI